MRRRVARRRATDLALLLGGSGGKPGAIGPPDDPPPLHAGFRHSAFTFGCESMVTKSNINGSKIAPGELVNLVQRGIMYTELERSVAEDGADRESAPFNLTTSSRESKQQREQQQHREQQQIQQQQSRAGGAGKSSVQQGGVGCAEATEPMAIDGDGGPGSGEELETPEEDVTSLVGHSSEVFICAWSPQGLKLASGSGDATARIWTVPEGPCGQGREYPAPVVLHHVSGDKEKSKDVTTLDWNHDGSALATGSYDGQARIWSPDGSLMQTLSRHKGPIFSLKWNKSGRYLLSGSVDKTAVVWDTATGTVKQEFAFHKEPTLDVDWRDDDSFASCSTDRMIYICKLNSPDYLRCFQGHRDEVNAIKWDPSGTLLASCSDDHTAKVSALQTPCTLYSLVLILIRQEHCVHRKHVHIRGYCVVADATELRSRAEADRYLAPDRQPLHDMQRAY